jgi:protein-glucosylgalactosylhydroxylysine glucosidase
MKRLSLVLILLVHAAYGQKINRKSVVDRHKVKVSEVDTLGSLSVGNGRFAFTVDV